LNAHVSQGGWPVLVLNADFRPLSYYPLSLWSWQDAIKAVFLDRVNIVEQYDRAVRSPSFEIQLPSVVSLKSFVKPTTHPAFTRANPNRLRALVGTFAQANPLHFHAASGAGYAFLGDEVLALDKANPTTAARLVQPLGQWRRYDAARQGLMCGALERILAAPGLSPNTYEMVAKSLGRAS